MKHGKLALALAAAMMLSGCYTLTMDLDEPDAPKGEIIGHFRSEMKVHHVVAGLITIQDPDVRAEITKQVHKIDGKSARNVRVIHQHSFFDYLLGGLSGGIYTPTSVIVEGDVAK